jgi:hypothetical protein
MIKPKSNAALNARARANSKNKPTSKEVRYNNYNPRSRSILDSMKTGERKGHHPSAKKHLPVPNRILLDEAIEDARHWTDVEYEYMEEDEDVSGMR